MRDHPPKTIEELQARNISTVCPDCNDRVTLDPVAGPVNSLHDNSYFVALCPNAQRSYCNPIFAIYQTLNDCIIERYPIPSFKADFMDKSIPEKIREDYAEAKRCVYVNAYKGAVGLYRRVVEAAACEKLNTKAKDAKGRTKRLVELIDTLQTNGLITNDIKESAHEIRLFGNYGVHVQDDGLDEVTYDEAQDVGEIAWQLLYTLYVAPQKTAKLKQKRKKKGTP